MQQQLFSNSISIGLSGKLGSNGFIYATPLPMIVCMGVNDVLFGHNVSETTPVLHWKYAYIVSNCQWDQNLLEV